MRPSRIELEMIHDAVIDVPCPRCGAPARSRCVNPVTGRPARVPCLARSQPAGGVPA